MSICLLLVSILSMQDCDVKRWILDLDNDSIEVRDASERKLMSKGGSALPQLERAREVASTLESRLRITTVMDMIRASVEWERAFGAAKFVTLPKSATAR